MRLNCHAPSTLNVSRNTSHDRSPEAGKSRRPTERFRTPISNESDFAEFPRLAVPIKIVAAVDLSPIPDMSFRRMTVLLTEHSADGRVVVRGVTDSGIGLVASMSAARFAEIAQVEFVESSVGWSS